MKTSELIKILENINFVHGDLPILLRIDGFGGHSQYTFGDCEKTAMYAGSLLDDDENLDENDIKQIIPEYDGNKDSLNKDFDYVEIDCGVLIYST